LFPEKLRTLPDGSGPPARDALWRAVEVSTGNVNYRIVYRPSGAKLAGMANGTTLLKATIDLRDVARKLSAAGCTLRGLGMQSRVKPQQQGLRPQLIQSASS
jgi:hypothetical protein